MYDFHVHSSFSADSNTPMLNMCNSALEKKLKGLCFTDHIDIEYPDLNIENSFSYDDYFKEVMNCKDLFKNKLEVYMGVELGLQSHLKKENMNFLKDKRFDFILGSIHCVNKKEMYGLSYLEGLSDQEGIDTYFENLIDCVCDFSDFDVLGHIDVFRRYLAFGEKGFEFSSYSERIEFILKKLIDLGKGIEINTSGLRYQLSSFHPLEEIIRLYKDLNGEIITLGSDSHNIHHIGYKFDEAINLLSKNKFKYFTIYKNRKPQFIKIEE